MHISFNGMVWNQIKCSGNKLPLSISQDEPLQKADSSLVNGDSDIVSDHCAHKFLCDRGTCVHSYTACEPIQQAQ